MVTIPLVKTSNVTLNFKTAKWTKERLRNARRNYPANCHRVRLRHRTTGGPSQDLAVSAVSSMLFTCPRDTLTSFASPCCRSWVKLNFVRHILWVAAYVFSLMGLDKCSIAPWWQVKRFSSILSSEENLVIFNAASWDQREFSVACDASNRRYCLKDLRIASIFNGLTHIASLWS